jgi:hypothetical protein
VTPLVWLAIPLLALLGAVLWAAWAGRERGPGDPVDSVEAHHRFVQALERSRQEPLPPTPRTSPTDVSAARDVSSTARDGDVR